ncbi:putative G-protein coupled receptor 141 [Discoglossus pictus]
MAEQNSSVCYIEENVAYGILAAVYTFVLIGGIIGTVLMFIFLCRTNTRSMTITAVMNLLIVHSFFLLTVPFRIAYYIQREWNFTLLFCKVVSSTIHIHMYLSFMFYAIMLVIRFLCYFKGKDKMEFYRKLHSVVASVVVWTFTLVIIIPILVTNYGSSGNYTDKTCFTFHKEIKLNSSVAILNYIVTAVVFSVVCTLLAIETFIIVKVRKKIQGSMFSCQEFRAQLKSLFFIFIMIICFFPYHMQRIYFIQHIDECLFYNEIFLSITALSCIDLLAFAINVLCNKWSQNMTCSLKCLYR